MSSIQHVLTESNVLDTVSSLLGRSFKSIVAELGFLVGSTDEKFRSIECIEVSHKQVSDNAGLLFYDMACGKIIEK